MVQNRPTLNYKDLASRKKSFDQKISFVYSVFLLKKIISIRFQYISSATEH